MIYCQVHCCWFAKKCPKCLAKYPPYLRTREEVADPDEWARYKRMGWTR